MRYVVFFFFGLLIVGLTACSSGTIEAAPDLKPDYPRNGLRPPCLGPETIMAIDVVVENAGDGVAPPFEVNIMGTQVAVSEELEPGDSVRILHPATRDMLVNPLRVVIDPNDEIVERDESNNEATAPVMTLTPPSDCPTPTP